MFLINIYFSSLKHSFSSHVLDHAGPLCERWIKNSGKELWVAIIAPPPWEHKNTDPCISPHLATADSSPLMMGVCPSWRQMGTLP